MEWYSWLPKFWHLFLLIILEAKDKSRTLAYSSKKVIRGLFIIPLIVIMLFLLVSNINSVNAEEFISKIPSGPTLTDVTDVAVDSSGKIYGLSISHVEKFDSSGNVLFSFGGGVGSGNMDLDNPRGLTADSSGNLYVADTNNHRIQKFNSAGVHQLSFERLILEICSHLHPIQ